MGKKKEKMEWGRKENMDENFNSNTNGFALFHRDTRPRRWPTGLSI